MKEILLAVLLAQENQCMKEALYHEARGEGFEGMVHVAAVIHNRVLDDRWPDTVCEVVHQPYQFSYRDTKKDLTMRDEQAKEMASNVTEMIMAGDGVPLLGNLLYYHANYVSPKWDYEKIDRVLVVGNHIFYTDRR